MGASETGQRFLLGIRAEIERDPNVKHAIIADLEIIRLLRDILTNENVGFLKNFQEMMNCRTVFPKHKDKSITNNLSSCRSHLDRRGTQSTLHSVVAACADAIWKP